MSFESLLARWGRLTRLLLLLVGPLPWAARAAAALPPPPPHLSLPLDSLRARLARPGTLPDTVRVLYLSQVCALLHTTDLPAAHRAGQQAVALARRIGYGRGEATALAKLAATDYYASDYPAAQRTFEATLKASQRAHMPVQIWSRVAGVGQRGAGAGQRAARVAAFRAGRPSGRWRWPASRAACALIERGPEARATFSAVHKLRIGCKGRATEGGAV